MHRTKKQKVLNNIRGSILGARFITTCLTEPYLANSNSKFLAPVYGR